METPLRKIRTARNLTLLTVANAVGVDEGHLSAVERNVKNASRDLALALVAYFGTGITRDEILFPEEHASELEEAS